MSHGNRNLALARSRYTMTLSSESGQPLDKDVIDGRVRSQTWQFNNRTLYDIDPKYQSACVKLRSLSIVTETAAAAVVEQPPALLGHANLDGADDHLEITLPDNTNVLSWADDWSLAFHMIEIHNATEGTKRTIATRGNNGLYISKGSANWGFYASATDGVYDPAANEGMTHSHGANTWFVPPDDSKHLFTYKASTGKLRWYCNDVLKATVQMTATEMTKGVLATDTLNIGDSMSGYYGSSYWDGHIDNLLIMSTNLVDGSQQVTEYFSNNEFDTHLEYYDKVLSWFKLDPDQGTYPAIKDERGYATGEHVGGIVQTAFVTTGEALLATSAVEAVPVASGADDGDGIGTPTVTFHLAGTPMPNNTQSQLPESIGPSSILAVVPTAATNVVGSYTCTNTEFAGSVAETGRLCAGTVINSDLRVKIQANSMLDETASAAFGLGEGVAGIESWTAEIEVQLLVNAPDTDSMDLG
mgnify:CR=1 FL=1